MICPCSPIPISSLTVCKTHLTVNPSRENDPDWRLAVPALTVRYVMHTICPRHPVCRPKPGKSSSGGLLTTSREFHPNCRPHCVILRSRAVAGREYHCHSDCHRHTGGNPAFTEGVLAHLGSVRSVCRPYFQQVIVLQPSGLRGVPFCGGSCFRTSELMYLTNGYSVVKEH